jgi:methylmalonyl-CoA mutase
MQKDLFKEFEKVSTKAWKQKIQVDLKGGDYQNLITKTLENIDIKPFYHYDEYKQFEQISPNTFNITQEITIHNESVANKIAAKSLINGAEFVTFHFNQPFDIDTLIQQLDFSKLIFKSQLLDIEFIKALYHKTLGKSTILVDPIGDFARYGNWYENETKDLKKFNTINLKINGF